MVNAENLLLVRVTGELAVQRMSGGEVMTERFLNNNALPAVGLTSRQQFGIVQVFHRFTELTRRNGEIEQKIVAERWVAKGGQALFEFLVSGGIREIAHAIDDVGGELGPHLFVHGFGAGKLAECLAQLGAE